MNDQLATREPNELEQMQLDLKGEKVWIDYSEPKGKYTGERFEQRPEAKIAMRWLAAGRTFQNIADALNVERRTIQAFYYRNIKDVEQQKEILRQELFPKAMMLLNRVEELTPDCHDLQKVSVSGGIMLDKLAQLSGVPSAHILVEQRVDCGAELAALLRDAEEKMKIAKAHVIEGGNDGNGSAGSGI